MFIVLHVKYSLHLSGLN